MIFTRIWIDGDRLVRRFTTTAEAEVRDSVVRNVHAQEEKTILELNTFIAGLQQIFAAPPPVIAFSDTAHFRRRLFPGYQTYAHLDTRGSLLYRGLTQYLRRNMTCELFVGMESIDVLGVQATAPNPENFRRLMVTSNRLKALVPGEWLDLQNSEPVTVSAFQADLSFFRQILLGNPVDDIEGCPNLSGEEVNGLFAELAGKEAIHREHPAHWRKEAWNLVVRVYEQAGKNREDALLCARLVRVLRFSDYDFKNREVKLWVPPET